jgi:ketosteroid isomerase-like protein
MSPHENAELARRFIAAVEEGATGERLAAFFHDDVQQHELPNRLYAQGVTRDRAALLASAEKGRGVLRSQRYEIHSVVASEDHVAIEMRWKAVVAIPLGTLSPGDTMRGHFAFFLEVRDGKIVKMRNYDCYEPF